MTRRRTALGWTLGLLVSCASGGGKSLETADSAVDTALADSGFSDSGSDSAADEDTGDPDCVDAPSVTWNSWGQGFLLGHCQGCHASTAPDRHGAPPEVFFDTVDDAWSHAAAILRSVTGEPATMPPSGGVDADEQELLIAWLTCAETGT